MVVGVGLEGSNYLHEDVDQVISSPTDAAACLQGLAPRRCWQSPRAPRAAALAVSVRSAP